MKYADLHIHTYYSDSTLSPEEVVAYAAERGLSAIAICDHDSVDGIERAEIAAAKAGIEVIPAIELTVEKVDAEMHLLGYLIDRHADWLRKKLKEMQDARVERVYEIAEKLAERGIDIDPVDVIRAAGKGSVGRLHIAQAMMKTGKIGNMREAFEKYIGFKKPCYVSSVKLSCRDAIGAVIKAGGVAVLAHPVTVGKDEYITELVKYGLRGLEVYHTDHKAHVRKHYEDIAKEHGLIMTGGSDCHGAGKGKVLIGTVKVPYDVVLQLREEAKKEAHA